MTKTWIVFFHLVDLFDGGLAHPTNGNSNTCQALTKGTMTSFNECFPLNSAPHGLSSVELHSWAINSWTVHTSPRLRFHHKVSPQKSISFWLLSNWNKRERSVAILRQEKMRRSIKGGGEGCSGRVECVDNEVKKSMSFTRQILERTKTLEQCYLGGWVSYAICHPTNIPFFKNYKQN